jgi:phosphatidylglycerophosphatase C
MRMRGESGAEEVLPRVTSEDVIARLDSRVGAGPLAVDADGTLWSGDIGIDAFTTLLEERRIRPAALSALNDEARQLHIEPRADANDQAKRLYDEFESGSYPEDRAFGMMAWALAGYSPEEARAFALEIVDRKQLASRLHGELVPVLRWAARKQVPLYVVSASPEWLVTPAVEQLRLPVTRVLAMKPAQGEGTFHPRLTGPVTYGQGKMTALRSVIGQSALLAAFGDSPYDLAMLGQAEIAVAVRPKPDLRARASQCAGLLELEPRFTSGAYDLL